MLCKARPRRGKQCPRRKLFRRGLSVGRPWAPSGGFVRSGSWPPRREQRCAPALGSGPAGRRFPGRAAGGRSRRRSHSSIARLLGGQPRRAPGSGPGLCASSGPRRV